MHGICTKGIYVVLYKVFNGRIFKNLKEINDVDIQQ